MRYTCESCTTPQSIDIIRYFSFPTYGDIQEIGNYPTIKNLELMTLKNKLSGDDSDGNERSK